MNYLAHAYLSFGDPGITTGNLISDFVKGKKKFDYPDSIQQGIALHRAIDEYTDQHIATREAKKIFSPHYRLYSGAIVDVLYDHYLANDENEFSHQSLYDFSRAIYSMIEQHMQWLPERFALMFPYMKTQNWLFNYRERWGTRKSLEGIVRRSLYLTESDTAFELFETHYQLLLDYYRQFWTDIRSFAWKTFELIRDGQRGS